MARLLAFVLTLSVGATGLLPSLAMYRCAAMKRLMPHPCCAASDGEVTLRGACCERVAARRIEARATAREFDPRVGPAPLVGILPGAPPPSDRLAAGAPLITRVRGSPPGDRLHQLSSVLRI